MTTKRTLRNGALCTVAAALAVGTGVIIGNADEHTVTPQSEYTPKARIESTPAPGSTIPAEQLDPQEDVYIDSLRVWGSSAMDTAYWTDQDLINYGRGTCAALTHYTAPADYHDHMRTLVPSTAPQTPAEDLALAQATAVNVWCPSNITAHAEMRR